MELSSIKNEDEYKVAKFLKNIGFTFIASSVPFNKSEAEVAREIDLLFTYENCSFIVEVSTVKNNRNMKIIAFLCKWSKEKNLERLKEKCPKLSGTMMRVFFDLSKDTPENKSQDVEEFAKEKGNSVVYKDEFEKLNDDKDIKNARKKFLDAF